MQRIHLADDLYRKAQQRATQAGFQSVDEYVASIVAGDMTGENLDDLFTADRLAELDQISARLAAGEQPHSLEDAQRRIAALRTAWQENLSR